ncbi:uncharacterized protein BT62DRAFT_998273 [Guyanagaster necrorhizus]|uniref:Uncharacterized protein n=1 Tax=Guyanagaster necrorhizus TaxID=856835 RepID=A0A9P8ALC7_9AGAR|nr:uncharacterized protein BT62DRAFT_998273 [Guyanagaster necrorhizus MCA 3950]KAG7439506.1 hypothetical protein BT62DRAFT_998273 [Guyanagaster necrorhizus MCA 3950]
MSNEGLNAIPSRLTKFEFLYCRSIKQRCISIRTLQDEIKASQIRSYYTCQYLVAPDPILAFEVDKDRTEPTFPCLYQYMSKFKITNLTKSSNDSNTRYWEIFRSEELMGIFETAVSFNSEPRQVVTTTWDRRGPDCIRSNDLRPSRLTRAYNNMVRITNESYSSKPSPGHRTLQKKVRNYKSFSVAVVKKEGPSDNDIIAPLSRSPLPKLDNIYGWRHPAELDYLDTVDWSKADVIKFLGRWTTVTLGDGSTTDIPTPYRIPLMFAADFQWTSLQLVLSVDAKFQKKEWDELKGGILHVARLCDAMLRAARRAMGVGMKHTWLCKAFDRALVRYHLGWLLSDPGNVQEFWDSYGKEEYEKDPVKLDWKRWVLKGYKGFKLHEGQIEGGITLYHWMRGLKEHQGDWVWDPADELPSSHSALKYLELWNKTGIWGKDFETAASTDLSSSSRLPICPSLQGTGTADLPARDGSSELEAGYFEYYIPIVSLSSPENIRTCAKFP